ncbi:MAG: RnfABCDGE type electron transport complex subunit D [Desulfobacteraceae bacterium]|nr:RnfABCDGE type electron transport complex subunit D [Desulfobacteraceae bacterium]
MSQKKFVVSHAPFWHNGSGVPERHFNAIIATAPAVLMGLGYFGISAVAALCLSVATAIGWEWLFCLISKRESTVADGQAILIGLIFGMLLPATAPWWLVVTGTFLAIVVGKQLFGGIGATPFHPAVLSVAILTASWKMYMDIDAQLVNLNFDFTPYHPLVAAKAFGSQAISDISICDLMIGKQIGGIGTTCGLALILGGVYLILRGYVRWQIPVSFIAGLCITAALFHLANPEKYAGPIFHLFAGYTLFAAFFLITDDSSSPVNHIPMLIYGALGGVITMLIRNVGTDADGIIFAVLLINICNPLIDKIRPKAVGKVA